MNDSEAKLIKEIFTEFKDEFPKLLLLLLLFLIIGMVGSGVLFLRVLDIREEIEAPERLLTIFAVTALFCLLGILLICAGCFIRRIRQNKKQENEQGVVYNTMDQDRNGLEMEGKHELGQKLTAYIIEQGNFQGNLDRDQKFIDINRNVTKTYSVLGTALTSLSEKENMLKEMAAHGVKIRLCTMNPRMTVDDICIQEIENQSCYFVESWKKEQMSDMDAAYISKLLESIKRGTMRCQKEHLLNLMHMLIEKEHMKEYYATSLDYENRIQTARRNLDAIQEKIIEKNGKAAMEIRDADSFIPISMTITDEEEEKGEMIVEFHLPFTDNKIMFFVNRKENEQLFHTFMDFYEIVWERAGSE